MRWFKRFQIRVASFFLAKFKFISPLSHCIWHSSACLYVHSQSTLGYPTVQTLQSILSGWSATFERQPFYSFAFSHHPRAQRQFDWITIWAHTLQLTFDFNELDALHCHLDIVCHPCYMRTSKETCAQSANLDSIHLNYTIAVWYVRLHCDW